MELQKGCKEWDNISIYRNVKPFCGNPNNWEEFSEKLKSQMAAGDMLAASVLDVVETQVSETNLEEDGYCVYVAEDDTCSEDQISKISTKLHNLLLNLTTGEANAVVRRCRGRHGLLAWKRLCTTLNPRTLASGVKAISNVMNPPRITDPKKAALAIEIWDDRIGKLDSEYGETLSSKMKMAVLFAMLPKDLQEKVLDKCAVGWDKAKEQETALIFNRVKEEVKNVAKSRRDMIISKPLDVDAIKRDHWTDEYTYDHERSRRKASWVETTKETKAKGNGGSHPRRPPRLILVVGAQATSSEIVRPKTANMCEKL